MREYRPKNIGVEIVVAVFTSLFKLIKKLFKMKKLLLIISLIIAINGMAQKRDTAFLYKAGTELIKYEKQYTAGIMMQLAGSAIVAAGAASTESSSRREPMIIGGGALTLIGFITQLISSSHIKKAGILLRGNKIVVQL